MRSCQRKPHPCRSSGPIQAPRRSTSLPRVSLSARVTLVNGDVHRIELPDDDPEQALGRLRAGAQPFNSDWVETSDRGLILKSAIVSMTVESGEGPLVA
jgi:hypothetical protein